MTAIDDWILELQQNQKSLSVEPLISKNQTAIAALMLIAGGIVPAGPQAANSFYAGPVTGTAAQPTFRAIDIADLQTPLGTGPLTLLTMAPGLVGTPSINFGDPASGFYRPAANQIGISANGANALIAKQTGIQLLAGLVGTPSLNFGDAASGFYRPALNQVAVSANGVSSLLVGQNFAQVAAGAVGTPSLIWGDATTGLYRPTANQVGVSASGAAQLLIASGRVQVVQPGTAVNPSLTFQDAGTGFYRAAANQIGVGINGVAQWLFSATSLSGSNAAGPTISNLAAASTVPTLLPNQANPRAGIGANVAGNVSEIVDNAGAALEATRASATGFQTFVPLVGLGVVDGSDAATGYIGEFISSTVLNGSAVPLSNGVSVNITSINLAAGDWDVWGITCFVATGTTSTTILRSGLSTTTGVLPASPNNGGRLNIPNLSVVGAAVPDLAAGTLRVSTNAPVVVYLVTNAGFTASTLNGFGFIGARRRR